MNAHHTVGEGIYLVPFRVLPVGLTMFIFWFMRIGRLTLFLILPAVVACAAGAQSTNSGAIQSEEHTFEAVRVVGGLRNPWALAFLPDGSFLVSERPGRLHLGDGEELREISGLPEMAAGGQGGMLDVKPHPDFDTNRLVYFTYSAPGESGRGTALGRGRLEGYNLVDVEELFGMNELTNAGQHFGSRIVFPGDGTVLFTIGDRGQRDRAQDFRDHAGSTIRLNDDGSVPTDNPWVGDDEYAPELFTVGNRNSQGMTVHPRTGDIWQVEHGPRGGDELNLIEAGGNYGWPLVSRGVEYSTGAEIGPDSLPGMIDPITYWVPAIAPSGMTFYFGDAFPNWRGNLFIGSLVQQQVRRLVLDGNSVVHEEVLLDSEIGRIRDIVQGPDGHVWLVTDESNGGVYRIVPQQ